MSAPRTIEEVKNDIRNGSAAARHFSTPTRPKRTGASQNGDFSGETWSRRGTTLAPNGRASEDCREGRQRCRGQIGILKSYGYYGIAAILP